MEICENNMLRNTQFVGRGLLLRAAQILGDNLRAIRKAKGLRQDDLAYNLGLSAPAVSRWENGECLPDDLDALANYLGIPVWKLFFSETSDIPGSAPAARREPSLAEAIRVVNAHILGDIVIKKKKRLPK